MSETVRLSAADVRQLRTVAEDIARRHSNGPQFAIEIAERENVYSGRTSLNIWAISSVPDWADTEVHTTYPWPRIREPHVLANGAALLDLYVRERPRSAKTGELLCGLQAELDEKGLVAIHANCELGSGLITTR